MLLLERNRLRRRILRFQTRTPGTPCSVWVSSKLWKSSLADPCANANALERSSEEGQSSMVSPEFDCGSPELWNQSVEEVREDVDGYALSLG